MWPKILTTPKLRAFAAGHGEFQGRVLSFPTPRGGTYNQNRPGASRTCGHHLSPALRQCEAGSRTRQGCRQLYVCAASTAVLRSNWPRPARLHDRRKKADLWPNEAGWARQRSAPSFPRGYLAPAATAIPRPTYDHLAGKGFRRLRSPRNTTRVPYPGGADPEQLDANFSLPPPIMEQIRRALDAEKIVKDPKTAAGAEAGLTRMGCKPAETPSTNEIPAGRFNLPARPSGRHAPSVGVREDNERGRRP